jgi:hypothetical protein
VATAVPEEAGGPDETSVLAGDAVVAVDEAFVVFVAVDLAFVVVFAGDKTVVVPEAARVVVVLATGPLATGTVSEGPKLKMGIVALFMLDCLFASPLSFRTPRCSRCCGRAVAETAAAKAGRKMRRFETNMVFSIIILHKCE